MIGDLFDWLDDRVDPDTQLSSKYQVKDLIVTSYDVDNRPDEEHLDSLKKLAKALEKTESKLGTVTIASGFRSQELNDQIPGASTTSRHLKGEAVDIVPHQQFPETYWIGILKDPDLKNTWGEITLKKYQGAIHLSLPYFSSSKGYVQGSVRELGSDGIYRSLTQAQIDEYLNKNQVPAVAPGGGPVMKAGFGMWAGVLVLLAGAGAFLFARRKR